jgi:hypothetical protein
MTSEFDPLTFPTFSVPAIWTYQKPPEGGQEFGNYLEAQALNGLIGTSDIFEVMLRLLLGLTDIERIYEPPEEYDPEIQGEWDDSIITFAFTKKVKPVEERRGEGVLTSEYIVEGSGSYRVELEYEKLTIQKISNYWDRPNYQ